LVEEVQADDAAPVAGPRGANAFRHAEFKDAALRHIFSI
jgi:hypothetical protein